LGEPAHTFKGTYRFQEIVSMLKKFVLAFGILALAVAGAENYKVTLSQPSTVKGNDLKAGEYRLNVENTKCTLVIGKKTVEVPVKIETVEKKFDTTAIRYQGAAGKQSITEIRIGGTKTKLVFDTATGVAGM
jgi:hypothetical protein